MSGPTQDITSSRLKEKSTHFDAEIELGKKLVAELDAEDTRDTLTYWMAHYVSELITRAENASDTDKYGAQQRCAEAILELWEYHSSIPRGKRPLESLEPILHTLESLDPDSQYPRYYRQLLQQEEEFPEDEVGLKKWLELAQSFDFSARLLIKYFLQSAVLSANDKTLEWVQLAEKVDLDKDVYTTSIRIILDDPLTEDENDAELETLQDRMRRLESFLEVAQAYALELKTEISQRSSHSKLDK